MLGIKWVQNREWLVTEEYWNLPLFVSQKSLVVIESGTYIRVSMLDMMSSASTRGYTDHSSLRASETTSNYIITTSSSSNSSSSSYDSLQLDSQPFSAARPIEVSMQVLGPVVVITDNSSAANTTTQLYTLDVLFRHWSYIWVGTMYGYHYFTVCERSCPSQFSLSSTIYTLSLMPRLHVK